MKIHESGDRNKPVILLLPGTMCYWKANFEEVISELANDFLVAAVAYTGFDETDKESYSSVTDELEKIEDYVQNHYEGKILASYGCSLGGTFIAHLAAKHRISMKYGIIGSSDMDQAGEMKARLLSGLIVKLTYNFVHNGEYKTKLMRKTWLKEAGISDVSAYFSLEDPSEIEGWSECFESVSSRRNMRGYRDIYHDVSFFHKLMLHFCDRLVKMKIIRIQFKG